ncbi:hypothetical protein WJX72_007889 [[Myrmecia] bisecta]|uniref:Large ribosomal subunit protein mL54 n=1 Tax=[Myrmecia] bisecta TaxID=41462 RepID=A0AAW1QRP3_9CHLO
MLGSQLRRLSPPVWRSAQPLPTGVRCASSLSTEIATGINIHKSGSDPPLKADAEYPDWVWALSKPDISLYALKRKGEKNLTMDEAVRKLKLANRASIAKRNDLKAK